MVSPDLSGLQNQNPSSVDSQQVKTVKDHKFLQQNFLAGMVLATKLELNIIHFTLLQSRLSSSMAAKSLNCDMRWKKKSLRIYILKDPYKKGASEFATVWTCISIIKRREEIVWLEAFLENPEKVQKDCL